MSKTARANEAYHRFCDAAKANGWTLEHLRCDVPPTPELLEAMGEVGLGQWEKFALRWEMEHAAGR